jgi:hypothetical protein
MIGTPQWSGLDDRMRRQFIFGGGGGLMVSDHYRKLDELLSLIEDQA